MPLYVRRPEKPDCPKGAGQPRPIRRSGRPFDAFASELMGAVASHERSQLLVAANFAHQVLVLMAGSRTTGWTKRDLTT